MTDVDWVVRSLSPNLCEGIENTVFDKKKNHMLVPSLITKDYFHFMLKSYYYLQTPFGSLLNAKDNAVKFIVTSSQCNIKNLFDDWCPLHIEILR